MILGGMIFNVNYYYFLFIYALEVMKRLWGLCWYIVMGSRNLLPFF